MFQDIALWNRLSIHGDLFCTVRRSENSTGGCISKVALSVQIQLETAGAISMIVWMPRVGRTFCPRFEFGGTLYPLFRGVSALLRPSSEGISVLVAT